MSLAPILYHCYCFVIIFSKPDSIYDVDLCPGPLLLSIIFFYLCGMHTGGNCETYSVCIDHESGEND